MEIRYPGIRQGSLKADTSAVIEYVLLGIWEHIAKPHPA
jgi:hypothetical protein